MAKVGESRTTTPALGIDTSDVIVGGVIVVVIGAGVIYALPWLIDQIGKQLVRDPADYGREWYDNQDSWWLGQQGMWPDSWWPNCGALWLRSCD